MFKNIRSLSCSCRILGRCRGHKRESLFHKTLQKPRQEMVSHLWLLKHNGYLPIFKLPDGKKKKILGNFMSQTLKRYMSLLFILFNWAEVSHRSLPNCKWGGYICLAGCWNWRGKCRFCDSEYCLHEPLFTVTKIYAQFPTRKNQSPCL